MTFGEWLDRVGQQLLGGSDEEEEEADEIEDTVGQVGETYHQACRRRIEDAVRDIEHGHNHRYNPASPPDKPHFNPVWNVTSSLPQTHFPTVKSKKAVGLIEQHLGKEAKGRYLREGRIVVENEHDGRTWIVCQGNGAYTEIEDGRYARTCLTFADPGNPPADRALTAALFFKYGEIEPIPRWLERGFRGPGHRRGPQNPHGHAHGYQPGPREVRLNLVLPVHSEGEWAEFIGRFRDVNMIGGSDNTLADFLEDVRDVQDEGPIEIADVIEQYPIQGYSYDAVGITESASTFRVQVPTEDGTIFELNIEIR